MANIARKYYNEELDRLKGMNGLNRELAAVSRNLNQLAIQGTLAPVFHREAEVKTIMKAMLRRTKPNILLTGPAGCGKTAIAEALAIYLAEQRVAWLAEDAKAEREYEKARDKWLNSNSTPMPTRREVRKPPLCDAVVYDLSMNSLLSGTKYRGDFEGKLQKVMDACQRDPNIILFIDEIHQMNAIGANEGSTSMGQVLKPALARAEVRVIGATTTEEAALLKKDKALARRFSEVEVMPLSGAKAFSTAASIMADYEKFHSVKVEEVSADQILEMVNYYIDGVFPNNFIDVIDETMSGAKFDGKDTLGLSEIKATLSRMSGKIIL